MSNNSNLMCHIIPVPFMMQLSPSGGRGHKRRRTSDNLDIEDRLESLITRVGEKVSQVTFIKLDYWNYWVFFI